MSRILALLLMILDYLDLIFSPLPIEEGKEKGQGKICERRHNDCIQKAGSLGMENQISKMQNSKM